MIAAAAVGLALAGAAPATSLLPVQKAALEAVRRAVAGGQIDASQAAIGRAEIGRAARLIRGLPAGRGGHVGVALAEVASLSGRLTGPRAVALFGQLKANDDYFARDGAPADKTDITDANGIEPVAADPLSRTTDADTSRPSRRDNRPTPIEERVHTAAASPLQMRAALA